MYSTNFSLSNSADIHRRDAERKTIENDMAACGALMSRLKYRLNGLAPISVLPIELLAEIFLLHAAQIQADCPPIPTRYYSWINISHVCSSWRAVALGCPKLWSNILVTDRGWPAEFLKRSQKVPLSVIVYMHLHISEEPLALVSKEIPRIRELRLETCSNLLVKIWNKLQGPAPLLETLVVTEESADTLVTDQQVHSMLLLQDGAQHLRRLELWYCTCLWRNLIMPCGLTHLKIVNTWNNDDLPPLADMLNAVERLPLLETLELVRMLPHQDILEVSTLSRCVSLPCLRSIKITSDPLPCAVFLNCLSVSTETTFAFRCFSPIGLEHLASCLAAKMTCRAQRLCSLIVERVKYNGCGHKEVYIQADTARASPDDWFSRDPESNRKTIEIQVGSCAQSTWTTVSTVCERLPLSNVEHLMISGMHWGSQEAWQKAFGHMRKVSALCVYELLDCFLPFKLGLQTNPDFTANARFLFPQLQALTLDSIPFYRDKSNSILESDPTALRLGLLRDCLVERRDYNAEIKELTLTDCANVNEDGVRLLSEVVGCVIWEIANASGKMGRVTVRRSQSDTDDVDTNVDCL
ncbi:hypothetical protein AcW1_002268 [Taiwanofungus camphoratus]|nr:hypothetical protein AcW1_002268 [Antrodia cinnamomea]